MAILGFPSTAIIGNLDWTGPQGQLVSTDLFSISSLTSVQLYGPGPQANSSLALDLGGIFLKTDDEATIFRVGADTTGIYGFSDGPIVFETVDPLNNADKPIDFLVRNQASQIVSRLLISPDDFTELFSTFGVRLSSYSNSVVLNEDGISIQGTGNLGSISIDAASGEVMLQSDQGINLSCAGSDVNIYSASLMFNSVPVATETSAQSKAIAMAIALG